MYSPKTRRSASEISPTVAKASTAAAIAGNRFSPDRARRSTSATAQNDDGGIATRAQSAQPLDLCRVPASGSMRITGMGVCLPATNRFHADDDLLAALDAAR